MFNTRDTQVTLASVVEQFMALQEKAVDAVGDIRTTLAKMDTTIALLGQKLETHQDINDKRLDTLDRQYAELKVQFDLFKETIRQYPTSETVSTIQTSLKSVEDFRWKFLFVAGMFSTVLSLIITTFGKELADWGHEFVAPPAKSVELMLKQEKDQN